MEKKIINDQFQNYVYQRKFLYLTANKKMLKKALTTNSTPIMPRLFHGLFCSEYRDRF